MSYDTITREFTGQPAKGVACWCGLQFAVPKTLHDYYERANDEKPNSFALHCPLGHPMVPSDPHALSNRLRDELARETHRADQAKADAEWHRQRREMTERQLAARKGQLTKLKKRVGNGVCPCCNRSFTDLRRHMQGQHPDWQGEESPPTTNGAAPVVAQGAADRLDWRTLASRRVALGVSVSEAASAAGILPVSLKVYESHGGSVRAAKLVADYLDTREPADVAR